MSSLRLSLVLLSLGVVPLVGHAQTTIVESPQPVNAVWVEKNIEFTYMGFTSFYSCDGLRDKLRWVLEEIGARPGFKVTVVGCIDTGPDRMPHARITAAMPRPATPELLAELAKEASRRDQAAPPISQFPARTRQVEFKDDPLDHIEDGDCELVEQLRDNVFIPLGARVVEDHMSCTPKQLNLGGVRLTIEVLEPVPEKK